MCKTTGTKLVCTITSRRIKLFQFEVKNNITVQCTLYLLFSSLIRLGLQCGDGSGSSYQIFVNGLNLANFTPPAGSSYLANKYMIMLPNGLITLDTVEFRWVQVYHPFLCEVWKHFICKICL